LPQDRADYAAGQICAVLANVHRAADAKVFQAWDFVLRTIEEEAEPDEVMPAEEPIDYQQISRDLERMLGKKEPI